MGRIRVLQQDYLEGGQELIDYKIYDYNGNYVNTVNENILYKTKRDLIPLNQDLVKEYERPFKKVSVETDLTNLYFKNQNAHFLFGDEKYTIQPPDTGTAAIISDSLEPVNALSGTKYFKSTETTQETTATSMIAISREHLTFPQGKPMTVGFNYYLATDDDTDKYEFRIKVGLQHTFAAQGNYDKEYDFDNDEWIDYTHGSNTGNMSRTSNETSTVNSWGKLTVNLKPYTTTSTDNDVHIDIHICRLKNVPSGSNPDFSAVYIDNFFIAETVELSDNKIVSTRTQNPNNGTYSAHEEKKGLIMSNEAENTDYFIGKIEGDFKRERDTVGKKLEQIITAEMLNDYRKFVPHYEGTFRDISLRPMAFHNKIHVDFGDDVFQEDASCYIDKMKFNVKAAEYDITMHVPNQDNDVSSFYVSVFD